MFGSLDAATLRSAGFNNRSTETKITKKSQPSKLVKNNNTDEIVYKNGNAHDSCSLSFSNGIKEHKQKYEEPPASLVPESVDQSISQKCVTEAETFVRSFEALDVNDTKDNNLSPLINPYATATELLPRGLIGYPTLRAFVEFISGFDVPSGRRSKKEDEFLLEIGKPLRPVMFDSVLNNFSPDMPNSFSGRPRFVF
ncbi:putative ubiquitinyl hydrolase 1 [Helianthus annuus]|uniref:Ubiquitinyl hydrolase 1 n=1 Tax=Helianthus annuus TaxID=4232 RepID=A0A9K3JPC9_HELAN|nr:putative ubiquitinyl hydrolase 1 [Helianthus annuus]